MKSLILSLFVLCLATPVFAAKPPLKLEAESRDGNLRANFHLLAQVGHTFRANEGAMRIRMVF